MKVFCILLLVTNAVYAGWRLNRDLYGTNVPEPVASEPLPTGIPTLRLLSENEEPPAERAWISDERPEESEFAAAGNTQTGNVTEDSAESESEDAGTTAVDENVTSLNEQRADATSVDEPVNVAAAEPTSAPDVATTPPEFECVTVGPFESRDAMRAAIDRMAPLVSQTRSRTVASQKTKLFQVFLEPSDSEAEAKERLEELKSKGIKDYLLIRRGEMRNAIQVGTFRSQESVAKRLAELESRGYKAIVVPKSNGPFRFWIDVAFDADRTTADALTGEAGDDAKASSIPCEQVAASGTGP